MFAYENDVSHYLDVDYEDLAVTNILNKFEIQETNSFLYNKHDDYRALLDYISELYIEGDEIPSEIKNELDTNLYFKSFLIYVVNEKMNNILSDSTTIVFKEIVTIVNLLSFGEKYNIFESYNFYNLESLAKLFRKYETTLQELKGTAESNFEITFNQYVILIETLNELCMINSTDILRKKTINPLIDLISETINIIKFNVKLKDEEINRLNNLLGKLLFAYSHIPFIDTKNKDASYLIEEYKFNFEKIRDGYHLSKNTNFSGDDNHDKYYKVFLNSITTLLSTLIYKLEITYSYSDYNNIELFKNIIEIYNEEISHTKKQKFEMVEDFKIALLKNYNYIYDENLEDKDYLYLVDEFIENKEFNGSNMSLIHSLVLFSPNIDDGKLLSILSILMDSEKYKNDYHEFYKLCICDEIINRFIFFRTNLIDKKLVEKIISYIEKNKIASHLLSIYSKLYLSLSLYYSYSDEYQELQTSKLYYYNYIAINGYELLDKEFVNLNRDILLNHGKKHINELDIDEITVSDEKYIEIGEKQLSKYFEQQDINLKYNINQKLSNIVTEIFTDEGLNNDKLNHEIEAFISKDIFHGLTFISIEGLCENECNLIDLGYERVEIPLMDEFKLRMAYSNVYKHIFESIYEKNKEYLKQNIINLIISYIKSIPIYHDTTTKLANLDKLKFDLLSKDYGNLIFVELYIENLQELNKKYNYTRTNDVFKEYATKVNTLVQTYRLSGPRLGFILDESNDYKNIIEKIKDIKLNYNGEKIDTNLIIAVSWGNRDNIIEKSSHSISLAQTKEEKYYEFK